MTQLTAVMTWTMMGGSSQRLGDIESPTLVPSAVSGAAIRSSSPSPFRRAATTRPRSRTIPVNTREGYS